MRIKWLGLMALVLAVLLPVGVFAEDDPDEGWDEDTPVYDWEVRDGTLYVKEGVEFLGEYWGDEDKYGHLYKGRLYEDYGNDEFQPPYVTEPFDKLHLPSTLRVLGEYALYKIPFFEEIVLPEGAEELCGGFMESCHAKRVYLSSTVRVVEPGAFVNAFWLETIDVSPDNPWYASVD